MANTNSNFALPFMDKNVHMIQLTTHEVCMLHV